MNQTKDLFCDFAQRLTTITLTLEKLGGERQKMKKKKIKGGGGGTRCRGESGEGERLPRCVFYRASSHEFLIKYRRVKEAEEDNATHGTAPCMAGTGRISRSSNPLDTPQADETVSLLVKKKNRLYHYQNREILSYRYIHVCIQVTLSN